jgi:hypothetical protein
MDNPSSIPSSSKGSSLQRQVQADSEAHPVFRLTDSVCSMCKLQRAEREANDSPSFKLRWSKLFLPLGQEQFLLDPRTKKFF